MINIALPFRFHLRQYVVRLYFVFPLALGALVNVTIDDTNGRCTVHVFTTWLLERGTELQSVRSSS
jgi:hypothetical protein